MSEQNPILDEKELANLEELEDEFDPETARELAQAFLEDSAQALPRIDAGMEARDAEEIRASAHMIKGCSRVVKAKPLEAAASTLEHSAKSGAWEQIPDLVGKLKTIYSRTEETINRYTQN